MDINLCDSLKRTYCEQLLKRLSEACFDFCRDDKGFIESTEQLKKYLA